MRSFIIGAVSALAFGAVAQAAGYGGGGYAMDAKGQCHDASGHQTKQSDCAGKGGQGGTGGQGGSSRAAGAQGGAAGQGGTGGQAGAGGKPLVGQGGTGGS